MDHSRVPWAPLHCRRLDAWHHLHHPLGSIWGRFPRSSIAPQLPPPACPHRCALTGCPEPGLEQKMVYLRMMPLGFAGGSQDTTTLLAEDGTALMPAGGPGTEGAGV